MVVYVVASPLYGHALTGLLNGERYRYEARYMGANPSEALGRPREGRRSVYLIIPESVAGLESLRSVVTAEEKETPPGIVLVFDAGDLMEIQRFASAGICAFLAPGEGPPALFEALDAAAAGRFYCSQSLMARTLVLTGSGTNTAGRKSGEAHRPAYTYQDIPPQLKTIVTSLTLREREVALLVAHGRTDEEVAQELFVAVTTVKTHLRTVFRKLEIQRRAQLVVLLNRPTDRAA